MVARTNGNGNTRPSKPTNGRRTRPARRRVPNGNALSSSAAGIANPGQNVRPVMNNTVTLSGSDYLGKVTVSPASGSGKIISTFPISPSEYPGTRLTQLANLWEFFRFRKFHVRWVPAVPTTLACQFVLYVDLDPSDDPTVITNEDALIRQAVAQTGAQQWNFICAKTIPMAMRADRQMYFTGSTLTNPRFSQQGKGYLIQVTNPINFNGEAVSGALEAGSLFIDWTVTFGTAQINPSAVVAALPPADGLFLPIFNISPLPISGQNQLTFSGLVPGEFYIISYSLQGSCSEVGYITGFPGLEGTDPFFSTKIGSAGDFRANSPPTNPLPNGFYPAIADANGEVGPWLLVVPDNATMVTAQASLYAMRPSGGILGVPTAYCRHPRSPADITLATAYMQTCQLNEHIRTITGEPAEDVLKENFTAGWPTSEPEDVLAAPKEQIPSRPDVTATTHATSCD